MSSSFLTYNGNIVSYQGGLIAWATLDEDVWLSGWSYRFKITTDNTLVSAANTNLWFDLANAPISFWDNVRSDGGDIRVTTSDGETLVAREVVEFNATSEEESGSIFFDSTGLSTSENTEWYVYYGNSGATEPTANNTYGRENVWDANYAGVWHMNDITTSTIGDSTANGNNGEKGAVNQPIEGTGKVGTSQIYDSHYISVANDDTIAITESITISLWVRVGNPGTEPDILTKGGFTQSYSIWAGGSGYIFALDNNRITGTGSFANDAWRYITGTRNYSNGDRRVYTDGVETASDTYSALISNVTGVLSFSESGWPLVGAIDEIRISNIARSAEWIETEFNNQNDNEAFWTVGNVEATEAQPTEYMAGTITSTSTLSGLLSASLSANGNLSGDPNRNVYRDNFQQYDVGTLVGQGDWEQLNQRISIVSIDSVNYVRSDQHGENAVRFNQPLSADQYSKMIIEHGGGRASYLGPAVRCSQVNEWYGVYISNNGTSGIQFYVFRAQGNNWYELSSTVVTYFWETGDTVEIELRAIGNELTVFLNGSLITSMGSSGVITDNTLTSGVAGICGYHQGPPNGHSFEAGDIGTLNGTTCVGTLIEAEEPIVGDLESTSTSSSTLSGALLGIVFISGSTDKPLLEALNLNATSAEVISGNNIQVTYDFSSEDQLDDFHQAGSPTPSPVTWDSNTGSILIENGSGSIDCLRWNQQMKASRIFANVRCISGRQNYINLYTDLLSSWNGEPWNPAQGIGTIVHIDQGSYYTHNGTSTNYGTPAGFIRLNQDGTLEFTIADTGLAVNYTDASINSSSSWTRDVSAARSTNGYLAFGAFETNTRWYSIQFEGEVANLGDYTASGSVVTGTLTSMI